MSFISGMRSSMSSVERVGKGENKREWERVWRVRVWCVRWEVREE